MRLVRLRLQGLTRFANPVEVDFDGIPPGLVCIAGPNGAGKTSLLGASGPAAIYRDLPPRSGDWLAPGGHVELTFAIGEKIYAARLWRTPSGSTSATLKLDGKKVAGSKVRAYDAAIRDLLGPPEAFYASAYAAQGGGGRLGALGPAERRRLFRFYLGLDRIQAIADAAKARIAAYDLVAYSGARRRVADSKRALEAATSKLDRAREAEREARSEKERARAILEDVSAEVELLPRVADYKAALAVAGDLRARANELRCASTSAELEKLVDAGRAMTPVLSVRVDALREADSRLSVLDAAFSRAEARCARAEASVFDVPDPAGLCDGCEYVRAASREEDEALSARNMIAGEVLVLASAPDDLAEAEARLGKLKARTAEAERLAEQARTAEAAVERAEEAKLAALEVRRKLPETLPGEATLRAAADARTHSAGRADVWAERAALLGVAETQHREAEKEALAAESAWAEAESRLTDLAPLELLAEAFGPTGLQAMEIDASGPAFSAVADKLVDACFPGRFSVELATQREKKSGGISETFDVVVYDAERGREGPIEMLSGGEQVVMDEAIRTALAIVGTDRGAWSHCWRTLWRDETPANLYGEVAERYLAMLARAREVGGYHHLIVVGGESVALGADTTIRVSPSGAVRIER